MKERKRTFMHPLSEQGKAARSLSVSLYPEHFKVLSDRARELLAYPSYMIQTLLALEGRYGFLRREYLARYRRQRRHGGEVSHA